MVLKIEKILKKRGVSTKELSDKTGIKLEKVEKFAKGELDKIEVVEMEKICSTLDCTVEDLFEK